MRLALASRRTTCVIFDFEPIVTSNVISARRGDTSFARTSSARVDILLGFKVKWIDVPSVPGSGLIFVEFERVAGSGKGFAAGGFFDQRKKSAVAGQCCNEVRIFEDDFFLRLSERDGIRRVDDLTDAVAGHLRESGFAAWERDNFGAVESDRIERCYRAFGWRDRS